MNIEENITKAARALKEADAILITAGAGIGVDSGLPDFRGNEGFWKAYPPIAKLGISFSGMANPHWFTKNPKLAWAFYGHRLNLYRKTIPHEGFNILLDYSKSKPGGYFVFTSNVDGHFQKAGFDEDKIAECHGSIHHLQCIDSCCNDIWNADNLSVEVDEELFEAVEPLPRCIHCESLARPNILMFGDWGWLEGRTYQQEERLGKWLKSLSGKNIAVLECGAGTSVPTVRYKSESIAATYNGILIRINPREYHAPAGSISIPLNAKEGITRIYDEL
ncbi:NAD-dependent deacetylase [Bacteroidota bacterium]